MDPRPAFPPEIFHDGLFTRQLAEESPCFSEIVKDDTERDELPVMLIRTAGYPLYPHCLRHAGEHWEQVSYGAFQNLNLERQRVAPGHTEVPVDLEHLLHHEGVSFVNVLAIPVMESYTPFAKDCEHVILSGQGIAAAREFENSLVQAGNRKRVLSGAFRLALISGLIGPVTLEVIKNELWAKKVLAYLEV